MGNMLNLEEASKKSRETMDVMVGNYFDAAKGFTDVAKSFEAIADEAADYSKKSVRDFVEHAESLSEAKSFEKALQLQTGYVMSAFQDLISEMMKVGGMYADLATIASQRTEERVATATKSSAKTVTSH
jgi:hypothetical protein